MQLQITVSTPDEAARAIEAYRAAFPEIALLWQRNAYTDEIEAVRSEQRDVLAAVAAPVLTAAETALNADELANDAAPVETAQAIDPATLGFGIGISAAESQAYEMGAPGARDPSGAMPPPPATAPRSDHHTAALAGVQIDVRGLPWDPSIHASTKTKVQDRSWKMKRGVAPEFVAAKEAELRAIMAIPTAAPVIAPPPPVAPPPTVAAIAPPPVEHFANTAAPADFFQLMQWLTPRINAGTILKSRLEEVCRGLGLVDSAGVGQVVHSQKRPDLVPAIYAQLSAA